MSVDPNGIFSSLELAPRRAVIAAVSGGGDSLALLFLLQTFLSDKTPATRLIAVTVDHGLRPEAAQEAETIATLCRAEGIAHRIMRWIGAKPEHGLQAAAREARYRLLAKAAEAEGTDLVLTGHTLDDQIETVAMRSARGDGRGLAGMAPATLYDGRIWIVRPLLGTMRHALRDYLRGRGIRWIDDPSNVDRKYERVRVRLEGHRSATMLTPLSPRPELVEGSRGEGKDEGQPAEQEIERLQSEIASAAAGRIELGKAAAGLIRTDARLAAPGLVAIDRAFTEAADRKAAVYALRILLATVGGTEQLPDLNRSSTLFDRLGEVRHRATLSRTVVDVRRTGIFLHRERRGLPEPAEVVDGMIWDGRYRIRTGDDVGHASIAPLGMEGARELDLPAADAPESLMRAALACQPAVSHSVQHPSSGLAAFGDTFSLKGKRGSAASSHLPVASVGDWQKRSRERPPSPLVGEGGRAQRGRMRGVGLSATLAAATAIPLIAPWARFLPSFDLAPCRSVAELVGADLPPPPPFTGHNGSEG